MKFLAGRIFISLVLFFTAHPGTLHARQQLSDTVIIKNENTAVDVRGNLRYYKDVTGKQTLLQIIAGEDKFTRLNPVKTPSFGFAHGAHWFQLNAVNHTANTDWYLELGYPPLDSIELYFKDSLGTWQMKRSGDCFPISSREVKHRNVIFKISLAPQATATYFIRIVSGSSIQLPLTIRSPKNFEAYAYQNQFANGVFYGIIFIMVFYNLFLFLSVKDVNTVYYILTLITGANVIAFFQGYAFFYLYPEHPAFNQTFSIISGPLFIITSLQLTRSFLTLKTFSFQLDRILLSIMIVTLLAVISIALFPKTVSFQPLHLLTILNCALIFISTVYCLNRKYRPARYFFLAWISVLLAALLFSLRNLGIISVNWINNGVLYVGGIMQTLLISFALGDRINILEKQNKNALEKERLQELEVKERLEKEVRDRTEEIVIKNHQLEELNHVKDKLFSIVSHDLKGPLNSLKGTLTILEQGIVNQDEFNKIIKGINGQLYQTSNFIENLLQWGRLQMQGEIFAPQPVAIYALVKDTLQLLQAEIDNKNIIIHESMDDKHMVYADANMILTVVRNLLSNALKFTNPGGRIQCSVIAKGSEIILSIKDTGTGIPPKYVSEIFTLKGVTTLGTREEKGTGIGLVLCKEFVEKNGGKIWCVSEMGKGSEFSFSLPAA